MTEPKPAIWPTAHQAIRAGQSPAIPGPPPSTVLGPACPLRNLTGCDHRARGHRALDDHLHAAHPGWEPTP